MNTIKLPLREWLELGQVLNDKCWIISYKWFRKHHTQTIFIGNGCSVKADGKTYKAGHYVLDETK